MQFVRRTGGAYGLKITEWVDERLDEPGTVFMAVGAGHLSGNKSVPDLLAERGIATSRVQ